MRKYKSTTTIRADKCKDGWLLEITERMIIKKESDVIKFIKQKGFKVVERFSQYGGKTYSEDNKNQWIIGI